MQFTRKQTFTNSTPADPLVCDLADFPQKEISITAAFAGTTVSGAVNVLYTAAGGSEQTVRDEYGVAVTIAADAPVVITICDMGRASQLRFTNSGLTNVTAYTVTVHG